MLFAINWIVSLAAALTVYSFRNIGCGHCSLLTSFFFLFTCLIFVFISMKLKKRQVVSEIKYDSWKKNLNILKNLVISLVTVWFALIFIIDHLLK